MTEQPKPRWFLTSEPYEAQKEALRRSYPRRGWGHFLDMGLGKSAVTLNEFLLFVEDFGYNQLIVFTPNSFKDGWAEEAEKQGFDLPILIYRSSSKKKFVAEYHKIKNAPHVVVFHFESLRSEGVVSFLDREAGERTLLAVDECIWLKDPKTIAARVLLNIAAQCGAVRALTGKPTTQGAHDLFGQLKLLGAMPGWTYTIFKNRFTVKGGFMGKVIVGVKNEEQLRELLSEWSWSARKDEWSDLPGKIYPAPRRLHMTPQQKQHYQEMEELFLTELGTGAITTVDQVITQHMKLQQITSGFIIDELGRINELVPPQDNPIIHDIKQVLDDEISGKLIVVGWHIYMIDTLLKALESYGVTSIRAGDDYEANKKEFNEGDARVIVVQQKTAKYGHTLLGTPDAPCCTTYFAENSYSLDDRSQIEDRNHRWGQQWPVVYLDKIMSEMDARKIRALQRKEDIAASILQFAREKGILPRQALTPMRKQND